MNLKRIVSIILCCVTLAFSPVANATSSTSELAKDMEKCARIAASMSYIESDNPIKEYMNINGVKKEEYSDTFWYYLDIGVIDAINKRVKLIYFMNRNGESGAYDEEYRNQFFYLRHEDGTVTHDDDKVSFEKQKETMPEEDITTIITALAQPLHYVDPAAGNGESDHSNPGESDNDNADDDKKSRTNKGLKGMCIAMAIPYIVFLLFGLREQLRKKFRKNKNGSSVKRKKKKPEHKVPSSHSSEGGNSQNDQYALQSDDSGETVEKTKNEFESLKNEYTRLESECLELREEKKEWETLKSDLLKRNSELIRTEQTDKNRIIELKEEIGDLQRALQQSSNESAEKTMPGEKTIDVYNANINEGENIKLEKAALTMNGGRVVIKNGGYVYIEPIENGYLIYPTNWITDNTIQEALSMYFNIEITGKSRILLKKPCVLSKDMYGYIVVEKGLVVIY